MNDKERTSAGANINCALKLMGIPIDMDENFLKTSRRFTSYLEHYTQPYDPKDDLGVTFPPKRKMEGKFDRAMVVQSGIPYRAACAHHLLPVLGVAHVGYVPGERVVGLSKLARLVYGISHSMPSLQEDVCDAVTEAIMKHLDPIGAMCVIAAEHGCMSARGVEEASGCIDTATSSIKGLFQTDSDARFEFYTLADIRMGHR